MRIFQVITLCELGGAQSVVVNLANRLCKEHEVIVIAGDGDGKMWTMLEQDVTKIKIKSLQRSLSPVKDIFSLFYLIKYYFKYKPDIIQLHSSKIGILGRIAFPKKKTVYTVHGFDSIRLAYRKYLPIERFLQNYCKAIVGVSKYDKNNLIVEKITHNVSFVYNGICKPLTANLPAVNIPECYTKRILCIARISKQKRFEMFLEIAELLPNYAFIWIGNQTEILDLPKNVFCLGNIPNAGAYNENVDLFILPTNYEGLPMVIIEAMSFGKPIVASNVGGISEIVVNGENGYTVENNSINFVEKIELILEDEDVYKQFSKNSLKRFNKDLTVDNMVNGYMKIYQS